jgi:Transglycosylase SLT domain
MTTRKAIAAGLISAGLYATMLGVTGAAADESAGSPPPGSMPAANAPEAPAATAAPADAPTTSSPPAGTMSPGETEPPPAAPAPTDPTPGGNAPGPTPTPPTPPTQSAPTPTPTAGPKPTPSPAPTPASKPTHAPAPTPGASPGADVMPAPAPGATPSPAATPGAATSPHRDRGRRGARPAPSTHRPANVRAGVGDVPPAAVEAPRPAVTPTYVPSAPASPAPFTPGYALASPQAAFRIPPFLLRIYHAAGKRYRVPWEVLAAINEIETEYGRNLNISSAGAVGWMQFMPATWAMYGVDANGDGVKDPMNPVDAINAAARYLRAAGAARDIRRAVFAYNHADWYVDMVMLRAQEIRGLSGYLGGKLLSLDDERLIRRVLDDSRIQIYPCGREDIRSGQIDRRVLATMLYLADSGLKPTITALKCGHGYLTSSGNVSEHSTGTAMDIGAINGIVIRPDTQGPGSITDVTIRALLGLEGTMKPHQIISLMTLQGADNTLALADHDDHIHVGWQPTR